jgi:hypothetical protein
MNLKPWIILAAFCLPAAFAGCRAGYEVDLRNMADQPVTAKLVTQHADGAGSTLRQTRIGPGDRGSVFVQTEGGERVALEVDFAGNVGYPATLDLVKGKTVVNVVRIDEGSKGRIRLEEVQRP